MECFCLKRFSRLNTVPYLQVHAPTVNNIYSKPPKKPIVIEQPRLELNCTKYYKAKCDSFNYNSEELSFKAGDILEVEVIPTFYLNRAKHIRTNKVGYVSMRDLVPQSLYEFKPWYFSNITRTESEDLLLSEEKGSFLVRSSMTYDHNPFTLSVRCEDLNFEPVVKHYKIKKGPYGFYISNGLPCDSLETLIALYLKDNNGQMGLYQRIIKPCVKPIRYDYQAMTV